MTCTRFPDACPNLRTVPPDLPRHEGGVQCGCSTPGPSSRIKLDDLLSSDLDALYDRAEQAETERDAVYRERAHLVALLAAMTGGAVIAPALDTPEPGWQIVYLTLGGRQASWHIAWRDADLFKDVEHVEYGDPRAQWDGHTTEDKYAHIAAHTAELAARGGAQPGPAATQATEPDTPTEPCNATIDGVYVPYLETVTCTEGRSTHGPNHVGPPRQYGQLLWTDHHAGATPHRETPDA
ncbi:hypothetical protein ACFWFB_32680 [Streptomyces albidoflavus]|uniref:hypothetical protein n=1 Tax=Micromonospora aurantiaca (nom. illeg.) TaxID=47850 RepID=UPI003661AE49